MIQIRMLFYRQSGELLCREAAGLTVAKKAAVFLLANCG